MPFRLLATFVVTAAVVQAAAGLADLTPQPLSTHIRPQDDLYGHANAGWLSATSIPPDRVTYDAFAEAGERVEAALRPVVEDAVRDPRGSRRQIADMYRSMIDVEGIEARGLEPMHPVLDRIDRVDTPTRLAEVAGMLSATATGGPFDGSLVADPSDPSRLTVRITQGGILLPERDLYVRNDSRAVEMRARYVAYLERLFEVLGRDRAAAEARSVLALETALAGAHATAGDQRGAERDRRYTLRELAGEMPGFDWAAWGKPQGITAAVVLGEPSFFREFAALIGRTPWETWRAWLRARYLTAVSPYVGEGFGMARFEFFGRFLTGQQEPRPRWRRGVGMIGGHLPDAVGRLYVERHFPPASKRRVERIAERVRDVFDQAIADAGWLSQPAKREARRKLSRLTVRVGYPEAWRDYRDLVVRPDDLLGNILRAQAFENRQQVTRARGAEDPRFWPVAAHSVNALHDPVRNEIVLPAGLLQPPFFDGDADEAINYGAIGGVIGHELSHAVDARGRYTDASGASRNWWTPDDERAFFAMAQWIVDQAASWPAVDGEPIDGAFTLVENAADLAGLSIAHRAYRASLGGEDAPVIDGLTGDQRFFLGWARAWRSKVRPEYVRQTRLTDPHAPAVFRVNGIVQHVDAFHVSFGVREGDRLYRPPAERLRVW